MAKKQTRSAELPAGTTIEIEGIRKTVATAAYISAKTKQLREFGYETLTEEGLRKQLIALLAKKPLTVIGMFMESEVIL